MKVNWGEVMYPYRCEPFYVLMDEKELLKRLRKISYELRQEETNSDICQDYKQLALHLADRSFRTHSNKEIQFYVAVCITNILRISSPTSPYDDHPDHPEIFLFLIDQLKELNHPQSGSKERLFLILSSLIHVNAFIVCDALERSEEIFTKLFTLMFQMLENNPTERFRKLALVLMESLLEQSEQICEQVLGIVLENYLKETNREVVETLLKRLEGTLSPYIEKNFFEILSKESNEHLMKIVYSLASELNAIYPNFLEAFLPRLKDSLHSEDIDKRSNGVSLLSNLLSARESNLGEREPTYLEAFFYKFVDKSERIRALCIRKCKDFLLNQPNLRSDVTKRLTLIQYDKCEDVRLEVVLTIIDSAKEELRILVDEPELLSCIEERRFDVSDRIRHEILKELTHLYREQCRNNELSPELQNVLLKILNKILNNYYLQNEGDKYFIERLVNVRLIDFNLETEGRIRNLYDLFVAISPCARSAFIQMQIHQKTVRKLINELLKLTEENDGNRGKIIKLLSGFFAEPTEAERNLHRFCADLMTSHELFEDMKSLMDPHVSCKVFTSKVADVLSKVADPDETDPYYNTIKVLLERSSSVLIDEEAVVCLIDQVLEKLGDGSNEHFNIIAVKGFYLLEVISFVFPSHFSHDRIIEKLIRIFDLRNFPNSEVTTRVLSIINNIGKYVLKNHSAGTMNLNELRESLEPICRSFAECGTPKQAKQAIRAICGFLSSKSDEICGELLTIAEGSLDPSSQDFHTAISTIGYVATYSSCDRRRIYELIKKLTIEVIVPEFEESIDIDARAWCTKDELPSRATCKLLAMKSVTRCLLSLQKPAGSTTRQIFEVFDAFVKYGGDIHRNNEVPEAERSWLRLQAGSCLLKLCKFGGFDDNMTTVKFYNLSRLMVDEVPEVRDRFSGKLEKGLRAKCPGECLAMDFMGFYALGGLETEEKMKGRLRWQMMGIIKKKKAFIENPLVTGDGEGVEVWSNLLPECVLVYAVPILAHLSEFSDVESLEQLIRIKKCLEFVLQPYVDNSNLGENEVVKYYGFFTHLIAKMKQCRDSEKPDDDRLQSKLSAVCDVAAAVIEGKTSKKVKILAEMETIAFDPNIPGRYLQIDEELDASQFGLSADVLENISGFDVGERKKMTAAKSAKTRMIKRTFGLKSRDGKKRRAENTSVGATTRKRRRQTK